MSGLNLIVHTGMHKTGTTSLQAALKGHAGSLRSLGIEILVNPPQVNARNPDSFDPDWIDFRIKTLLNSDVETLILSAECISLFGDSQLDELLRVFDGLDSTLVLTLRHWVTYLPSRWGQNCRRCDSQSFGAFLHRLFEDSENHIDARFDVIVDRMATASAGKLKVVSFDNAVRRGELLQRLLSECGLPAEFVERCAVNAPTLNRRSDLQILEICRLFNGVLSQVGGLEPNRRYEGVLRYRLLPGTYDLLPHLGAIRNADRALYDELSVLVRDTITSLYLSQSDERFRALEASTFGACEEYLVNPENGSLYGQVADNCFEFSTVETDDLDTSLKRRMFTTLDMIGLARRRVSVGDVGWWK